MKQVFTFIFTALLAVNLQAAKLVVESGGSGGAYSTMQAAIDAAVPGDQIYVYPGTYSGFNITTGGFSIVSAFAGQRYQIVTNCIFGSITAPVHISNAIFSSSSVYSTSGPASPQTVRFTDSKFTGYGGAYLSDYENFFAYYQNDTFSGNAIATLTHGAVTGCFFSDFSGIQSYNNLNPTITGDTLKIIGNHFHCNAGVSLTSSNELIYVEGNYFEGIPSGYSQFYCNRTYTNAATGNTIINNTFNIDPTQTSASLIFYYDPANNDMSKFNIQNNVFINATSNPAILSSLSNNGLPPNSVVDYNIFSQSSANAMTGGVTTTGTNNIFSTTATINTTTGALTSGAGIDAGHPNPAFYDLDKTRNDMGCYGGSYSRANFDQPDNGSRVLMLTAPRVVLTGNSATIKADGLAK